MAVAGLQNTPGVARRCADASNKSTKVISAPRTTPVEAMDKRGDNAAFHHLLRAVAKSDLTNLLPSCCHSAALRLVVPAVTHQGYLPGSYASRAEKSRR